MSFQVVPGAICEYLLFGSRFDALSGAGALLTTLAGAWAIVRHFTSRYIEADVCKCSFNGRRKTSQPYRPLAMKAI